VILHQDGPSEPFLYQHFRYFSGITYSRTKSISNTAEILPFNSRPYCTRAYSARTCTFQPVMPLTENVTRLCKLEAQCSHLNFHWIDVTEEHLRCCPCDPCNCKLSPLLYCRVPVPIGFQLTHALTCGAQPRRRTVLGRELKSGANNIWKHGCPGQRKVMIRKRYKQALWGIAPQLSACKQHG
jgi:hypothetical protein